jgi:hypothetical protein
LVRVSAPSQQSAFRAGSGLPHRPGRQGFVEV